MGNLISSQNSTAQVVPEPKEDPLKDLKEKIDLLENRVLSLNEADQNNDGIVSKEELENWKKNQDKNMEEFKNHLEQKLNLQSQIKINELEKEISGYKDTINKLEKEKKELYEQVQSGNTKQIEAKLNSLSKEKISHFVDTLIKDEDVNINYLPDFVERQIYKNVFTILINLLDNIFDTTKIEFLGHQINFDLRPKIEDKLELQVEGKKNIEDKIEVKDDENIEHEKLEKETIDL